MDLSASDPNVTFSIDAQTFLDNQSVLVQADVIARASWLYGSPAVDGETKFLILGPREFGVRTYRRVYDDGDYVMVYGFDDQADPPLLTILDISISP